MRCSGMSGVLAVCVSCAGPSDYGTVRAVDPGSDPEIQPDAASPPKLDAHRQTCDERPVESEWQHEDVASYVWAVSAIQTFQVGVGVDATGTPHVGYVPFNGNCCWSAYHATRRDGRWLVTEAGLANSASASQPRVAFPPNGDVWLGYGSRGGWIAVEHDETWTVHGLPDAPEGPAVASQGPVFAAGPEGEVHWFYGVTGAVAHASGTLTAADVEAIASLEDREFAAVTAAVHDGQSLHVVYDSNLRGSIYLKKSGEIWSEADPPIPPAFLATDQAGRVYFLGKEGSQLLFGYPENGAYATEVVLDSQDTRAPSLWIDPTGVPRVAVIDGDALLLASRIQGSWSIEVVSDFVRGAALTVDASGRAHVFYGGPEVRVMYATRRLVPDPECR